MSTHKFPISETRTIRQEILGRRYGMHKMPHSLRRIYMKKVTIFGGIFSVLMLGVYVADTIDLYRISAPYLTPNPLSLFSTYPWWWLLCTIIATVCGGLAPILYFCGSVHCIECAYTASSCHSLMVLLNFLFRFRVYIFHSYRWFDGFITAIVIILITLAYAGYLHSQKEDRYSSGGGWRFLGSR